MVNNNSENENLLVNPAASKILKGGKNWFILKLTLFKMLPMAALANVGLTNVTTKQCTATVPYKFLNKNPFKSTYFAVLSMAAEFSTGYLLLYHTHKRNVAWLVTNLEAKFIKKATGITYFTCVDGEKAAKTVDMALKNNEAQKITMNTIGKNKNGDVIAEFNITWSIKKRSKK